jgi:hypothetical protein
MEEPMKSPIALLRALITDVTRLQPGVKGLDRDLQTIEHRFEHEGYGFLTVTLPAFCDNLFEGLSKGRFCSPLGFRCRNGSVLPLFLGGLLSELFESESGLVKPVVNEDVVISLRQIGYMFKKIQLDERDNDKLHRKAVIGFFSNDALNGQTNLSEPRDHHLSLVCRHLLSGLKTIKLDELACKHGPGAVEEGLRPNQKWSGVFEGVLADSFDTERFGYDTFGIIDRIDLSMIRSAKGDVFDRPLFSSTCASRSSARLISVAKNSTSRRTITIEPMLNQFVQQGLNQALRDSIEGCPILSGCLALTDQSQNQKLALVGSIQDNWSTLDLKSASDLLSLKIVETVFGGHPEFLQAAIDCRSPTVTSDGIARTIGKFAGMGNALTFPVQSVVFAVLAIAAIVDGKGKRPNYRNVMHASRCIRVFGDDIIVKTEYVHQVIDWLQSAGLVVNTKKSFLAGKFKESCGMDAYNGVNVTPVYLRFRPDDSSIEPSAIAGLVAFSNQVWLRGYYSLGTIVQEEVERRLGYRLPLVSKDSGVLGWFTHLDAMNTHGWDSRLQCLYTKATVLVSLKRRDYVDGWAALLKFFHVPLLGRPLNHLKESSMRFKLRISKKRVPTRVG